METWKTEEWKKNNASLELKRQEAIKYLGNNWLIKGGLYSPKLKVLKNVGKNS